MQKIFKATIAITAFVLMITMISSAFTVVTFAAEDINGNRIIRPVPAYKKEGPSPWHFASSSGLGYNHSGSNFNPYSSLPDTEHVLWARGIGPHNDLGGIAGGYAPTFGFYLNDVRADSVSLPISAYGRLYVRQLTHPSSTSTLIHCYDLETGEYLWTSDVIPYASSMIQFVQLVTDPTGQPSRGDNAVCVISGTRAMFLDWATGKLMHTKTFPRSIKFITLGWEDTIGQLHPGYSSSATTYFMYGSAGMPGTIRENYMYCYQWTDFEGLQDPATPTLVWLTNNTGGLITYWEDTIATFSSPGNSLRGIDRFTGEILWEKAITAWNNPSCGYGKLYIVTEDQKLRAFDLRTGNLVWEAPDNFNAFTNQQSHMIGNGMVVSSGWDGTTRAYDAETGELMWKHYMGDTPFEPYKSWYGTWPTNVPIAGCPDGYIKVTTDHMFHNPPPAGETLTVFNLNGSVRWQFPINGYGVSDDDPYCIVDGMIVCDDAYTGQLFVFGKGPSGVEVSVPNMQISLGATTYIMGKVTDQSPGQPDTPAVSREDMYGWMAYLHCGLPDPGYGKTGVSVDLYAQGSDGTTYMIGSTQTNGDTGEFVFKWTPQKADLYSITGIFNGDDSYWGSNSEATQLIVVPSAASASATVASVPTLGIIALAAVVTGGIVIKKSNSKKMEETKQ